MTVEPPLDRWWERTIDARVATAVGLSPDADEEAIARHFRVLAGRPAEGTRDARLWARFLYGVELARTGPGGPRGDEAQFANNVAAWTIVLPDDPEHERYGSAAWDRELGVTDAKSDDILRGLAYEEIAPRLERAGLYALL